MTYRPEINLNIALIHHPVLNKRAEIIGSAVTNLDVHDIARLAKTYGVAKYFITTPYEDQRQFVQDLLDHWRTGYGATYNPARREALSIVCPARSLEEVVTGLTEQYNRRPLLVATSAILRENIISYKELGEKIVKAEPILLLLGTAHGLAPEIFALSDASLPPIGGGTKYNHLSVRSATSIIIDRLLGS